MDVLREREVKDSLERQLTEEQKLRSKLEIASAAKHIKNKTLKFVMSRAPHTRSINFSIKSGNYKKSIIVTFPLRGAPCNKLTANCFPKVK